MIELQKLIITLSTAMIFGSMTLVAISVSSQTNNNFYLLGGAMVCSLLCIYICVISIWAKETRQVLKLAILSRSDSLFEGIAIGVFMITHWLYVSFFINFFFQEENLKTFVNVLGLAFNLLSTAYIFYKIYSWHKTLTK